jgi:hypothetical protein
VAAAASALNLYWSLSGGITLQRWETSASAKSKRMQHAEIAPAAAAVVSIVQRVTQRLLLRITQLAQRGSGI